MMLKRLFVFTLCLCVPLLVRAQSTAEWEQIYLGLGDAGLEIVALTPSGIDQLAAVPENFDMFGFGMAISSDRRWLVSLLADGDRLLVADLESGTCCQEWQFSDQPAYWASLAGFKADSSQVAVAYMVDETYQSAMVILDVATGEIVARRDTTAQPNEGGVIWYPEVKGWRGDAVLLWMTCAMCVDTGLSTDLDLWNPATDEISKADESLVGQGDRLEITGEQIDVHYDPRFPVTPDRDYTFSSPANFGARNVVTLTGGRAGDQPQVIYFNPDSPELSRVAWVADGNAFIVFQRDGTAQLILPDGEQHPLDFTESQFVTGTPDGWVIVNEGIIHYTLENGQVQRSELAPQSSLVVRLDRTPLGSNATATFVPVQPEVVTCPGFLPSQLVIGSRGRVTPNDWPNNLRAEPSASSELLLEIPAGEPFAVMDGPVCAENMAWWQVYYGGELGWTAEGQGDTYWLQPG